MTKAIPFNIPYRAPNELERVAEALASGWVSGDGPFSRRASLMLEEQLEGGKVLLTTSGTHALELAALLLGVGSGDEVVLPSFTFPTTASCVALRGATIRFADVDPGTFSMELPQVRSAATAKTHYVILMHYGGITRDADRVVEWCSRRRMHVIEDAAHALFGRLRGTPLGRMGRVAALSFHATKNISAGECGALVLNDRSLLERALVLREKGTDRSRFLRGEVDRYTWQEPGSSYLPSDVLAALLVSQLEAADEIQSRRSAVWHRYRELLEPETDRLGLQLQEIPEGIEQPYHTFALLLPRGIERQEVTAALLEKGIHAYSHYEPLHRAPGARRVLGGTECAHLPVTDEIAPRLLRLPLFPSLALGDAAWVVEALVTTVERLILRKR